MPISLAARANPIFLSKNFVNRGAEDAGDLTVLQDGGATASSAFLKRLFDMTRASFWTSLGSDDTKTEEITIGLYEGVGKIQRDFNFVALLNFNALRFKVESRVGAGAFSIIPGFDFTGTDFTGTDLVIPLAVDVTADQIRITITTTQTPNAEKIIGEVIVAKDKFQTAVGLATYDRSDDEVTKVLEMADGSKDFTMIFRSDASFEFFNASVAFTNVLVAELANFRALKADPEAFLFYPEPGDVVADIFLCRIMPGSWRQSYLSMTKGSYVLAFEVEEIGGA